MNIKGFFSNIMPSNEIRSLDRSEKALKMDEAHDRDANGQQQYGENQQEQRQPMTEEQLEKAMEHLRNLPSLKEHKWTVDLEYEADGKYVIVRDNLGNTIRRIPELEMWDLPTDASPRGQLLKRSA